MPQLFSAAPLDIPALSSNQVLPDCIPIGFLEHSAVP
jgi:hypothetical protein